MDLRIQEFKFGLFYARNCQECLLLQKSTETSSCVSQKKQEGCNSSSAAPLEAHLSRSSFPPLNQENNTFV
jgi:hypothetical protein